MRYSTSTFQKRFCIIVSQVIGTGFVCLNKKLYVCKDTAEHTDKICHILAIQENEITNDEWLPSHHQKTSRIEGSSAWLIHQKQACVENRVRIKFIEARPLPPPNGENSCQSTFMLRRHAMARVKKTSRIGRQNDAIPLSASKI
jgi:hypothetical protein